MRTDIPETPIDETADAKLLRETIRLTALGVSASESENVFRELVKNIATALNVDHAFIGVLEPEKTDEVRIIAGYFFHKFQDNFTYPLTNTPCENVIGQQFRYYPENVQQLFSDPHIRELRTEGYAGIPLYDSNGDVLGLMAVADHKPLQDKELTESLLKIFSVRTAIELERRNADKARSEKETELRKSEDRIRAMIEAAIDCIIAMDSEGKIIEFNPAAEHCFGYNKFDILGKPLADLIIPERYREQHNQGMAHFGKSGEGNFLKKRVEVIAMRADGSEFPAELAIDTAQGIDGEIFIGYLRDISERREAENQRHQLEIQLQQAQKMEAIGQLTGGIAHDFNNILTSMTGYVTLAKEQDEIGTNEKLSRYLDRAQRSGQRARDLIQQMLTFSRGQQGETRAVSLEALINDWADLLESTLPSSVEIKLALEANIPDTLIDPVQIEQVLTNLCINARDAMQGSGILTIGLSKNHCSNIVCASCRQPVSGEFIELTVSDTGMGIPIEVQQRIFEPFYSTKDVGQGSGMGLSMVHGIIHKYDSHLVIDSTPGEGATLRILLKPFDHQNIAAATAGNIETDQSEKLIAGSVLLVDDEPSVSEFMQDLLDDWGLSATVFNNSVDACKAFSDDMDKYDLVILDQTMPKMSGMELSQQLLKLRPDLPIILYTGYTAEITEKQVIDQGISALVKKPVDTAKLHNLIKTLLAKNSRP